MHADAKDEMRNKCDWKPEIIEWSKAEQTQAKQASFISDSGEGEIERGKKRTF